MREPNFENWIAQSQKQLRVQQRRPTNIAQPGYTSRTTQITDWNGDQANLTGFYWSDASAGSHAPDDISRWAGWVNAVDDFTAVQKVVAVDDTAPQREYIRQAYQPGPSLPRTYGPWVLVSGTPAGIVLDWAGAVVPTGFLLCNGQAVSRTDYANLFSIIGVQYGVGNGTTTFNVPNALGKVTTGLDAGQTEFAALGQTGGSKTHLHGLSDAGVAIINIAAASGANTVNYRRSPTAVAAAANTHSVGTSLAGSSYTVTTTVGAALRGTTDLQTSLQPYITFNKIIRY